MIVIAMRLRVGSSLRLKNGSSQDDASHGNLWSMLKRNHFPQLRRSDFWCKKRRSGAFFLKESVEQS